MLYLYMLDVTKYNISCMKEPEYIIKIMATGGTLCSEHGHEVKPQWTEQGISKSLNFSCYKLYDWQAVTYHKNPCQSLPSLEDM